MHGHVELKKVNKHVRLGTKLILIAFVLVRCDVLVGLTYYEFGAKNAYRSKISHHGYPVETVYSVRQINWLLSDFKDILF